LQGNLLLGQPLVISSCIVFVVVCSLQFLLKKM
jgi:hypothetical protein